MKIIWFMTAKVTIILKKTPIFPLENHIQNVKKTSYKTLRNIGFFTVEKVRDFLNIPHISFQDIFSDAKTLEEIVKKQQFLEEKQLFDPLNYFSGLIIGDLSIECHDPRLKGFFHCIFT